MNIDEIILDYQQEIFDMKTFIINSLITAVLSWILARYYKRYGTSVSNRARFSNNFMLLSLSTMLIIYIVKSSIALSLGLVGALSIVRFRAAIKEPEELTFLFLVIGIGLGMGANQRIPTIVAFILIIALLYLQSIYLRKGSMANLNNQMVVNVSTSMVSEDKINEILMAQFQNIEMRRLSHNNGKLFMTYVVEAQQVSQISQAKSGLLALDSEAEFSFVDNNNMIG